MTAEDVDALIQQAIEYAENELGMTLNTDIKKELAGFDQPTDTKNRSKSLLEDMKWDLQVIHDFMIENPYYYEGATISFNIIKEPLDGPYFRVFVLY